MSGKGGIKMGRFQDEIAELRRTAESHSTTVDQSEGILLYQKEAPAIVKKVCDDIRSQIKERAKHNQIKYDHSTSLFGFGRVREVNPHYMAGWSTAIKFDKKIYFQCAKIEHWLTDEVFDGFVVSEVEPIMQIMKSVETALAADDIYFVAPLKDTTRKETILSTEPELRKYQIAGTICYRCFPFAYFL